VAVGIMHNEHPFHKEWINQQPIEWRQLFFELREVLLLAHHKMRETDSWQVPFYMCNSHFGYFTIKDKLPSFAFYNGAVLVKEYNQPLAGETKLVRFWHFNPEQPLIEDGFYEVLQVALEYDAVKTELKKLKTR
jgi:hypothetical protein